MTLKMQIPKIKTIAIVGPGAMGAAYAAMFSGTGDFSPFFLADGERFQRLKKEPLTVNGKMCPLPVLLPEEVKEPADLVLVALKHHHLADALPLIQAAVGPETTILSVMNGLESEQIIGSVCGMEKMVYAIAVGIDAVREGNTFSYARPGKIIFGEGPQKGDGSRVAALQEALTRAAIPHEVPADIMFIMWWKFMINVGVNQASAVLRAPTGFSTIRLMLVALCCSSCRKLWRLPLKWQLISPGKILTIGPPFFPPSHLKERRPCFRISRQAGRRR